MDNFIKQIYRFMKGSRLLYAGAVAAVGLATFFSLILPLIIKAAVDGVLGGEQPELPGFMDRLTDIAHLGSKVDALLIMGGVYILFALLNGLFLFLKGKWSAMASESFANRLREKIYWHLQELPYDYHVDAETGDLIQRATSDVETVRKFLAVQFVEIGRALFMVSITLYFMLSLDVMMTIYSMVVVPVIFAFSYLFFTKVQKAFKVSDEAEGKLSAKLQENLAGVRVVRAFGRQRHESEKFDKRNAEYRDLTYRLLRLLAFYWAFSDVLCLLQIAAVLFIGGIAAINGIITMGTLIVFVLYEGRLLWPVRQMGRILTDLGKTSVSIKRIMDILDEPVEQELPGAKKPVISGDIVFRDVSFSYGNNVPVLHNIDLDVKAGETVAILGPTGCGKSTLMYLLAGLYRTSEGKILLDGHDIDMIERKWLRKNVGFVLQEPFLYSRTIKENIGIMSGDMDDSHIFQASQDAHIHHVINEFEHGYDTTVGEKGVTLSGGQKQRVAIARTLTMDYPVLIFDDSLSAVDMETDAAIRQALGKRTRNCATFIISHRINTLAQADKIIVMEHGRIIQQGTHGELISREGLYKKIAQLQNEIDKDILEEITAQKAGDDYE